MRTAAVALLLLFAAAAVMPAGPAQSIGQGLGATDRCVKNCQPNDVNGPVPKTGSEPTGVILYAHMEDILILAPLNTQRPDPKKEPDSVRPLGACAATHTGTSADFKVNGCEFTMFSSPGLVEYTSDGWRTHMQPGLSYNASVASPTINAYFTLRGNPVAPNVGIYARLVSGRFPSSGQIIAESAYGAAAATRHLVSLPGDSYESWEYEVPLAVKNAIIPDTKSAAGFAVFVRVFQIGNEAATVTQPAIGLHVGAKFPPRLAFTVNEPMRTRDHSVVSYKGTAFFRWSFEAVWGSYDIDAATLAFNSTGPTHLSPEAVRHVILRRSTDMNGYFKPVNSTWSVDYNQHRLADGAYEVTASILNLQHTYRLEQKFAFDVEDGVPRIPNADIKGKGVPAPSLVVALAALAAAFVLARRT
ncbi:MAG: hypothetical protein HYT80_06410 [Euryarchaeota archaeon]|nr:hypothetical protein [Euryarchaeota archaeon]